MRTFVIPDAHGNGSLVRALLEQEGLIEQDWSLSGGLVCAVRMRPSHEVAIVQLGDLANCVAASINDDLDAIDMVFSGLIDTMLVGNHEHPYFGGPPFSGWWRDEQVERRLLELNDRDRLAPSYNASGILLTHAGVHSAWGFKSASYANACLNEWWDDDPTAQAFSLIGGSRSWMGGAYGGVLWCDWSELSPTAWPQIVGHSLAESVRTLTRRQDGERMPVALDGDEMLVSAVCLDLGAGKGRQRIAGAWIEDGAVRVVEYDADRVQVAA